MALDESLQNILVSHAEMPAVLRLLGCLEHRLKRYLAQVAPGGKLAVDVIDVRYAARHSGAEVAVGPSEHYDRSAGHVLAAVIACALDNSGCSGVPYCEALACDAAEVGLAGGCAVKNGVAADDVLLSLAGEVS